MATRVRLLLAAALAVALGGCDAPQVVQGTMDDVIDALVAESCDRRLVALGEGSWHGEATTTAFKADVVERLVRECGFTTVAFEASAYQFAHVQRRADAGEAVSADDVATAGNGMLSHSAEMSPLNAFLAQAMSAGEVQVVGLDYSLSQYGQDFANFEMASELAANLSAEMRGVCEARVLDFVYGRPVKTVALRTCTEAMVEAARDPAQLYMATNLDRRAAAEANPAGRLDSRKANMLGNLSEIVGKDKNKIIVWAASVHFIDGILPPLSQVENDARHVVAFSAKGGRYATGGTSTWHWPAPAEGSLENYLSDLDAEAAYIGRDLYHGRGWKVSAIRTYEVEKRLAYDDPIDAVVVFREMNPLVRRTGADP